MVASAVGAPPVVMIPVQFVAILFQRAGLPEKYGQVILTGFGQNRKIRTAEWEFWRLRILGSFGFLRAYRASLSDVRWKLFPGFDAIHEVISSKTHPENGHLGLDGFVGPAVI